MAEDSIKLFGFEIKRSRNRQQEKLQSIVPPVDEDGSGLVTAAGAHYGTYVDLDGEKTKDEKQLIHQYRAVSHHPDCLLYTSPSPRDRQKSRMPSSA